MPNQQHLFVGLPAALWCLLLLGPLVFTIVPVMAGLEAAFVPGTLQSGDGTYYGDYGGGGTCMLDPDPATRAGVLSVALNKPQFGDSIGCGMCIEVRGQVDSATGKVIGSGNTPVPTSWTPAFVNNLCPECLEGSLDLAKSGDGRWHIEWRPVLCPESAGAIQFLQKSGSSVYHIELQVRNTRIPITGVAVNQGGTWKGLARQPYNYWKSDGSVTYPLSYPLQVRITGIDGCVLTDTIPADKPDTAQTGTVQFGSTCSGTVAPAPAPSPSPATTPASPSPSPNPSPSPAVTPPPPTPTATCTPQLPSNCTGTGLTIAMDSASNVNWVQVQAEPNADVQGVYATVNGNEQLLKRETYNHFTASVPGSGVQGTVVIRAVKNDGTCVGALLKWNDLGTPCVVATGGGGGGGTNPAPTGGAGADGSGGGSKAWVAGIVVPLVVIGAAAAGFVLYKRHMGAAAAAASGESGTAEYKQV